MSEATSGKKDSTDLLHKLCLHLAKNKQENADFLFKIAIHGLSSISTSKTITPDDEYLISEKIKQKLKTSISYDDYLKFETLLIKLHSSKLIENRASVLTFLYSSSMDGKVTVQNSRGLINFRENIIKSSKVNIDTKTTGVTSNVRVCTSANKDFLNTTSSLYVYGTEEKRNSVTDLSAVPSTSTCYEEIKTVVTEVSESKLMQEAIYSFQGIEGKVLKLDPTGGFRVDSRINVNRSYRRILLRLAELGYLHNRIKQFCESSNRELGIIVQSLVSAYRDEMTEYYKLVAVLQDQLNTVCALTMRRLLVWVIEPKTRLQWLVTIADIAQDKKGGALVSTLFTFIHHGSPTVQNLSRLLLNAVCRPLLTTISRWVLDGQLDDPCAEFFIEVRQDVNKDRLWHEKYRLRPSMLPSFITSEQAEKILATGKSIDFLREVCQERAQTSTRSLKHMFDTADVETLYMGSESSVLHSAIENTYKETSKRVLEIMMNKYNLNNHMLAMKRYLLLGQGDFIRHLMELLMPELSLPATQLLAHNLSAILESAVRVTNARYEDPDILARLDVKTLQISGEDTGWEVFTLCYHTHGPIGTIFKPCEDLYFKLFASLWNVKRLEFILSGLWKNQTSSYKMFRNIPGIVSLMQHMHLLTSEMIHLVHQMQYYLLFEVIESQWAELSHQLAAAENLDDVFKAHKQFLEAVCTGALLDHSSEELGKQLRNVYSHIIKLQMFEEKLYNQANTELKAEQEHEKKIEATEGFGTTARDEALRKERHLRFQQILITAKGHLHTLALTYQKSVRKFLSLLASQEDVSLQLLSFRLDFNGHYKRLGKQSITNVSVRVK